jgi:hypothetical protein
MLSAACADSHICNAVLMHRDKACFTISASTTLVKKHTRCRAHQMNLFPMTVPRHGSPLFPMTMQAGLAMVHLYL